jgi:hypothetical protein
LSKEYGSVSIVSYRRLGPLASLHCSQRKEYASSCRHHSFDGRSFGYWH